MSGFEQQEAGRFRINYGYADEYHLTVSAEGYDDAEAFTPKITQLKTIDGIIVKLKRHREGSKSEVPRQEIAGRVTRDGKPLQTGWVGLWELRKGSSSANAPMLRGRTVESGPVVYASAPIVNGTYSIEVPYQSQNWYLVVDEPGRPLTQLGPIPIKLNEKKKLDIVCAQAGRVRGRVARVPEGWAGRLWVVAFSKTGIRQETRVEADGQFSLVLPAGEYGLKVGHDAYEDVEVPHGANIPKEAWKKPADPWKRAKAVKVESGQESKTLQLELP